MSCDKKHIENMFLNVLHGFLIEINCFCFEFRAPNLSLSPRSLCGHHDHAPQPSWPKLSKTFIHSLHLHLHILYPRPHELLHWSEQHLSMPYSVADADSDACSDTTGPTSGWRVWGPRVCLTERSHPYHISEEQGQPEQEPDNEEPGQPEDGLAEKESWHHEERGSFDKRATESVKFVKQEGYVSNTGLKGSLTSLTTRPGSR